MENYKGIFYGTQSEQYQDPTTGAHFEYFNMVNRLRILQREIGTEKNNSDVTKENKLSFDGSRNRLAMNYNGTVENKLNKYIDAIRGKNNILVLSESWGSQLPPLRHLAEHATSYRRQAEFCNAFNSTMGNWAEINKVQRMANRACKGGRNLNVISSMTQNLLSKTQSHLSAVNKFAALLPAHFSKKGSIKNSKNQLLATTLIKPYKKQNSKYSRLVVPPQQKATTMSHTNLIIEKKKTAGSRNILQPTTSLRSLNLKADSLRSKVVQIANQMKKQK